MLRCVCLFAFIVLSSCSTGATKFPGPDASAPVWDLNPGKWQGTNDLIHEPTTHQTEANNEQMGL